MKAKEYFRQYVEENQDKEQMYRVIIILMDMFTEVEEIRLMRKAKSDLAIIAILNEQNTKANSFIRKVNEIDGLSIKNNAFKELVKQEYPDLSEKIGW